MEFPPIHFYLGIDPQISLLAIHCSNDYLDDVFWFQQILKKKVSSGFKNAEDWELYLANEINQFVDNVDNSIKSREDHTEGSIIYGGVEQQRGRVNSIIEAMLVAAGVRVGWRMCVPHPTTWKKSIGLKCAPGNKNNKNASVELVYDDLSKFYHATNQKLPARVHDLCDAKCISEHVYNKITQNAVVATTGP